MSQTVELERASHLKLITRLRADPVFHAEHIQGVRTLLDFQKKVMRLIADNDYVAIKACHDVGKTFISALILNWFMSSFRGAKAITTAPTWTQVEHLLWAEIRTRFYASKFPLGGRMLTTEWKLGDDWFALGISPKDDADITGGGQGKTSGFQGFHAPYLLVLFDEATGVPSKRWIQAQGMLTSANVKFVAVGNPTTKNCEFHRCFSSRIWKKVHLSCFDSPNLQANGVSNMASLEAEVALIKALPEEEAYARIKSYKVVAPAILTLAWVIDRAIVWGLTHPLFISKALGDFPDEDDFTLISLGTVENAQRRVFDPRPNHRCGIGVDVARYGTDKSVISTIWGRKTFPSRMLTKRDTVEVTGATMIAIQEAITMGVNPELLQVGVDATGIGAGVFDNLKENQRNGLIPREVQLHEIHFGQTFDYVADETKKAEYKKLYANRKAKIYVELAQDLKSDLALPEELVYLEELPTIVATYDSKGHHVIESKEDYRDRTKRPSPDHSDALAIANEMLKEITSSPGVMRVHRG